MSEAAHVPFTETKAPESAERLHRGALGLVDISASTMANIGPAYSFYFSFAGIVILAGLASPLVVLVAPSNQPPLESPDAQGLEGGMRRSCRASSRA